MTTLFRYHI